MDDDNDNDEDMKSYERSDSALNEHIEVSCLCCGV